MDKIPFIPHTHTRCWLIGSFASVGPIHSRLAQLCLHVFASSYGQRAKIPFTQRHVEASCLDTYLRLNHRTKFGLAVYAWRDFPNSHLVQANITGTSDDEKRAPDWPGSYINGLMGARLFLLLIRPVSDSIRHEDSISRLLLECGKGWETTSIQLLDDYSKLPQTSSTWRGLNLIETCRDDDKTSYEKHSD